MISIPLSLYVHLPWCVRKCPYCDFNSYTSGDAAPKEQYLKALVTDIAAEAAHAEGRELVSVFLGGGTPSLFTPDEIGRVLDSVAHVFYYAMEYLNGMTLSELIKKHGPQPEGRVIHILEQVCGSLAEAHGAGLVHRDIKPANIMLCTHGGMHDVVKVLDFGLVQEVDRADDTDLANAGLITGTALYLAPEATEAGGPIDARSDLYAVGAVGYYLLTGKPVFSGLSMIEVFAHHLHTQPTPPSERVGHPIAQDLEDIILKCLAKDREERPPTAGDLRDSLNACDHACTWDQAKARAWAESRSTSGSSPESAAAPPGRRRPTVEIDIKRRLELG